jgi:hypothetical protein
VTTHAATWTGTQISIASVRSGDEVLGTVRTVEATALLVDAEAPAGADSFRVGDNLRVGWADHSRWQHGVAMLIGLDHDAGRYTVSIPSVTAAPEVRREASRIEAFFAIRALAPDATIVNGRSFEVSIGGFSARFAERLAEGVPFAVSLEVGDTPIAAVVSIIRYSDRYAHATFLQIREDDRERLALALGLRAIGG